MTENESLNNYLAKRRSDAQVKAQDHSPLDLRAIVLMT